MAINQHPLQGLLTDMPKLLLQWRMMEEESTLQQARLDAEKEIQIASLMFNQNEKIYQDLQTEQRSLLETYDALEDEINQWGPLDGVFDSLSEVDRTTGSEIIPVEFTGDYLETINALTENNQQLSNKLRSGNESLRETIKSAKKISNDLQYLETHVDDVTPWTAGIMDQVDKDDLGVYFDTVLTGDGSGQFSNDPTSPNYTESYDAYRDAFLSKDPGFAEDATTRENIRQLKKAHREELDNLINNTYSGLQAEVAGLQESFTVNESGQQEKWSYILYGPDSDGDEVPADVAGWLNEGMRKTSGREFLMWLEQSDQGQVVGEWMKQNPYWADRLNTIQERVAEYNDPYKGAPTERSALLQSKVNAILTGSDTVAASRDPEVILQHFQSETAGIGEIEANVLWDNMIAKSEELGIEGLHEDIELSLAIKQKDINAITEAYKNDMSFYETRRQELTQRINDGVASESEELELERVNRKINQLQTGMQNTKLELGGLDESSMYSDEGVRYTPEEVYELLTLSDDYHIPFAERTYAGPHSLGRVEQSDLIYPLGGYEEDLVAVGNMFAPGYVDSDQRNFQFESYIASPYGTIDGDNSPYIDAFDAYLEEKWEETHEVIREQDRDPLGPDFLSPRIAFQHDADRLRNFLGEEEFNKIMLEGHRRGNEAAMDRLNEVLSDPDNNRSDYIEILQVLDGLKSTGEVPNPAVDFIDNIFGPSQYSNSKL
tara:strand:+ start:4774 stop:6933 length:2160 start_codon:yes stop_codon:yes gene_type:complete